ncbi:MAG: FMN-binding protein [Patescibacteria group bacterium]|nr:FMN-binding protein [Patescibacteria group bacterium]MCL5431632.1 FMN-binding protein [Patescibacteria group bacterium]
MKKILLSGLLIIAFGVYALHQRLESQTAVSSVVMPMMPAPMMRAATYKDGVYTGAVADAYYGNVQVQATVTGGKITDVVFLQYPNDRPTSREINAIAMPALKQEAISAQNAQVDIVSGATQTSMAFQQSLASALTQAQ